MCQNVGRRYAGSSERRARETRISLFVPGCEPPQLYTVIHHHVVTTTGSSVILPPQWLNNYGNFYECKHNNNEYNDDVDHLDESQQRLRRRGRRSGSHLTSQRKICSKDTCQISQPRRCPGGLQHGKADIRFVSGSTDNIGWKRYGYGSTFGTEKARSSACLQPGSSDGCARPIRNGTQPCRFQNGFYPTTGAPRGQQQATYRWQDAFLSWPFPSSIQVN